MPRLTVAIPTYNRCNLLAESLRSLLQQIDRLDEPVDIVISDNASTDDTSRMVNDLINKGKAVSYFRNSTNLGMDKNADMAIRRSRGQYVLLMSDDDMLEENSIYRILNCLSEHPDLGIIYMNYRIYDGSLTDVVDMKDSAFDSIEADSYFSDGLAVVQKTRKIFAAISGGVYRRELWLQADPERYVGTVFIHVGVTMEILCKVRCPAYIYKSPLFKYRLNNSAPGTIKNYGEILKVSFGLMKILTEHKKYVPKHVFRDLYNQELYWTREKILGVKARESVPTLEIIRIMRHSLDTSRLDFWLLDVPMLLIPHWLLKLPYLVYRFIMYHNLGSWRLENQVMR